MAKQDKGFETDIRSSMSSDQNTNQLEPQSGNSAFDVAPSTGGITTKRPKQERKKKMLHRVSGKDGFALNKPQAKKDK